MIENRKSIWKDLESEVIDIKPTKLLESIRIIDTKLEHMLIELDMLRNDLEMPSGVNYEGAAVQTSKDGDTISRKVIRLVELERDISSTREKGIDKG